MNKFTPVIERYRTLQRTIPPSYMDGKSDQVTIIDMGHGGLSPDNKIYATAPKKMAKHKDFTFLEGPWTRAVGYSFARELGLAQRNYAIISTDKDIPLLKRVQLIKFITNQFPGKKFYVNCIHGNAFGLEKVGGVEVYTSPGATRADPIASEYFNQLAGLGWRMRAGYGDGDSDKEARFTMLTGPEKFGIPSILPEIGFYTNYDQAVEMCQPDTMDDIAQFMKEADIRVDYKDLLR